VQTPAPDQFLTPTLEDWIEALAEPSAKQVLDADETAEIDVSLGGRLLIKTVLDEAATPITLIRNWKPPQK